MHVAEQQIEKQKHHGSPQIREIKECMKLMRTEAPIISMF